MTGKDAILRKINDVHLENDATLSTSTDGKIIVDFPDHWERWELAKIASYKKPVKE